MGNFVLRALLSEIKLASCFAIIADEASDVPNYEQMCVAIRWVDEEYEMCEEPIGLIQVPCTDSETPTTALRDVLLHCMLLLSRHIEME